jgi:glycosyltransferase involved in cell wall biosynthesis
MSREIEQIARATRLSSRLRVLQVIGSLHFGGAERLVAHLATGIDRARFEMTVCCTREAGKIGQQIVACGMPVVALGSRQGLKRYGVPLNMLRLIRAHEPDVLHTHGLVALTDVGPLAYLGALPYWIHTFHYGNYPYKFSRQMWLERTLSRRASILVAVADAQRDAIAHFHRLPNERLTVVPNGVIPNPFLNIPGVRGDKRQELGFEDTDFVVASISVLSEQKGVGYFLQAAARIRQRHPEVKFLVVGGGPLELQLRSEAARLGLSEHVRFTGWRADIQELLLSVDVYVMASLWEAMPLALLEAMAARRAIVVTDVGNNADIVGFGEAAMVVPPRNAEALADGICNLITNSGKAQVLASRALDRFERHYTTSSVLKAYQSLYEQSRNEHPADQS